MQDDIVKINGLITSYSQRGEGKPIFFLHGWGGNKHSWDLLSKEFDLTKYHLFILDLPGFGNSVKPPYQWQVDDYTNHFHQFVQKMYTNYELKGKFNLIIHSFGGRIAIKYCNKWDKIQHLVLIGAAGIKPINTLYKKIIKFIAKCGKSIFSLPILNKFHSFIRKVFYKALRVHDYENTSGVMKETFINVINEDLTGLLEQINCATLILWGSNDSYVPLSDAKLMHNKINGSVLKVIEDGRHGIHKTHATLIGGWINSFLNKN